MNPLLSNCCLAPPLGEVGWGHSGYCSSCREGAVFGRLCECEEEIVDPTDPDQLFYNAGTGCLKEAAASLPVQSITL